MSEANTGRLRSVVVGTGCYLPETVVTNRDLAERLATSDEWIVQRTGITRRHIAAADERTSTLAIRAAKAALRDAGLTAGDLDLVVVATSTPDFTFPSVATQVQHGLGMTQGAAFDLQAVCSGFVFAVATADKFLISGSHRRALVIGAETFSRILDWEDRTTCVLFGDGAAAVILEAQPGEGTVADRGVLTSHLRSDGRHIDKLYVDGGPSATQTTGRLRMAGKEVFRHAVGMVTDVITDAFRGDGHGRKRSRLVRAAPSQSPHHRCFGGEARHRGAQGRRHGGPPRQHVGRLHSASALRRPPGRPNQGRRPRHDRGDGRRLHLGLRADPLVGRRFASGVFRRGQFNRSIRKAFYLPRLIDLFGRAALLFSGWLSAKTDARQICWVVRFADR